MACRLFSVPHRGFFSCGPRAELPCSMWDLSSLTRDQTLSPCIRERWILNHWTTREVLKVIYLFRICFPALELPLPSPFLPGKSILPVPASGLGSVLFPGAEAGASQSPGGQCAVQTPPRGRLEHLILAPRGSHSQLRPGFRFQPLARNSIDLPKVIWSSPVSDSEMTVRKVPRGRLRQSSGAVTGRHWSPVYSHSGVCLPRC